MIRDTNSLQLRLTVGLIAIGLILLATGVATQERFILIVSMLSTALAALPLVGFGWSDRRAPGYRVRRAPRYRVRPGPASAAAAAAAAGPTYDDLDTEVILPVLPLLERAELKVLRDHEARHRGRRAILSTIDQLLADGGRSRSPADAELDRRR